MRILSVVTVLIVLIFPIGLLPARSEPVQAMVSITFDDSFESQYLNAFPVLKKYGLTATAYVVTRGLGEATDDPIWRLMTWNNIRQLRDAGWEIGSHTLSHPHLPKLDDSQLNDELVFSAKHLERQLGVLPRSFAAPFGEVDDRVLAAIKKTYKSNANAGDADASSAGMNDLGKVDPYNVSRLVVPRDMLPDEVCEAVGKAVTERKWLVLAFHQIVDHPRDTPDGDYMVSTSDFDQISKCVSDNVKAGKLKAVNVTDGIELSKNNQSALKATE
jgi:peptidoglycan/xylan/chitin deacetylase (PgdA/CDA1 family)